MVHSFSSLDLFRQCPCKYKFKYVERRALPPTISAELEMGRIVHAVIEKLYRAAQDGVLISREDAIDEYDRMWSGADVDKIQPAGEYATVDDTIRAGARLVGAYWEKYQPFDEGTLIGAEDDIVFDLPGTTLKFRGKIDRLWKRDDGVIEVCDYKTGRRLAKVTDNHFKFQMGLYHLAVKTAYPHFETIEVAQYFLRMDEIVRYRFPEEELDMIAEELRQAVAEVVAAKRLEEFPTREDTHCSWCEYFDMCPAKVHRKRLDEDPDLPIDGSEMSVRRLAEQVDEYLELDGKIKELKVRQDALKEKVTQIARETGWDKLSGTLGDVRVTIKAREKFITKGADASAHADLAAQARLLGLDEYMAVDASALLKAYQKNLLPPEYCEKLRPFIVLDESVRIVPKRRETDSDSEP
ncbi:DUF2800 domain-containing protein [candidate division GN15 bacterium]|nr:DUF2800 domain-containing protein [candidate division GN15 bacterium]